MSEFEIIIFIISLILCGFYLVQWFYPLYSIWPPSRVSFARFAFFLMPLIALIIFIITVNYLASFDVVSNPIYQMFYIVLGYAWIFISLILVSLFLGLSWKDDIFHLNNKAALPTIFGAYLAVSLIYAGANIGDGPGWWCVIFAGGMGLILFFVINIIFHKLTGVIEKITIDRDMNAGIRMGFFLLASGVILGRASGGDWISLSQTVIDFWVAWPMLPLMLIALIVEGNLKNKTKGPLGISVFWGIVYLALAIVALFFLPSLPENPFYSIILKGF
ncbi:MAG: hypothetical protein PHG08_03010 [Bacilli bacterium]|jgi:hypothetical protein|nr:hypothetical protein [Bacilli bacterium]HHU24269.1 hypothetical protein [Acholeplasmataceae bacterium]